MRFDDDTDSFPNRPSNTAPADSTPSTPTATESQGEPPSEASTSKHRRYIDYFGCTFGQALLAVIGKGRPEALAA